MANYCHLSYEDRKYIEDKLNDNKLFYQIKIENNDTIKKCYLTTKKFNLPYVVFYILKLIIIKKDKVFILLYH